MRFVDTSIAEESMNSVDAGALSNTTGEQRKLLLIVLSTKLNRIVESGKSSPDKSISYQENESKPSVTSGNPKLLLFNRTLAGPKNEILSKAK